MNNTVKILSLVSMFFLLDCGSVPSTYYYRVMDDFPAISRDVDALPVTLGVGRFDADVLYEGERIVYRNSPYEVQYYHYRRWIAPPRKLVEEQVFNRFQSSGAFQQVLQAPSAIPQDYVLTGKIRAFEEWDEADAWYGFVKIRFELHDARSNEAVWRREFTEKTLAVSKEPVAVVEALSKSLNLLLANALDEIVLELKSKQ